MQVKKQQLEPDMEQRTGSKLGKEYVKAVYCHPDYLTYMKSTSCKMPANMENSAVATGLEKVSFHSNPKERQCQRMFKLPHNWTHLTCCKVMLKILQARLQQYVNHELPDVQAGFQKDSGTRDQIANIHWIIKKTKEFQKNIYFCFIE